MQGLSLLKLVFPILTPSVCSIRVLDHTKFCTSVNGLHLPGQIHLFVMELAQEVLLYCEDVGVKKPAQASGPDIKKVAKFQDMSSGTPVIIRTSTYSKPTTQSAHIEASNTKVRVNVTSCGVANLWRPHLDDRNVGERRSKCDLRDPVSLLCWTNLHLQHC